MKGPRPRPERLTPYNGRPQLRFPVLFPDKRVGLAYNHPVPSSKEVAMPQPFSRAQMLLGAEALDTLARARVIIFGIGGVGGAVAEGLARCGVGAIDLVDHDTISETNLNRQLAALHSTVGKPKAQVMAERIRDINPTCQVRAHQCLYLADTKDRFDLKQYDYVIDAVDTVTAKLLIVSEAQAAGVPVISSMGTANKLDPTAFEVADIYDTSVCPLAKIVRKESHKRGLRSFKVVYSREKPLVPQGDDEDPERPAGRRSTPGSVSFVPPVAGFILAGEVIRDLIAI